MELEVETEETCMNIAYWFAFHGMLSLLSYITQESLLVLQRMWVQSPEPTWWFSTTYKYSSLRTRHFCWGGIDVMKRTKVGDFHLLSHLIERLS